ncbi:hypothetical protein BaRGS_00036752 [Batillaria attramentaria]|uniref:Uncharacterized protein n=1 Tax=Batillaria attramentaria TaxID=370345 RepID=A0ABD0JAJ5_9CAEN
MTPEISSPKAKKVRPALHRPAPESASGKTGEKTALQRETTRNAGINECITDESRCRRWQNRETIKETNGLTCATPSCKLKFRPAIFVAFILDVDRMHCMKVCHLLSSDKIASCKLSLSSVPQIEGNDMQMSAWVVSSEVAPEQMATRWVTGGNPEMSDRGRRRNETGAWR